MPRLHERHETINVDGSLYSAVSWQVGRWEWAACIEADEDDAIAEGRPVPISRGRERHLAIAALMERCRLAKARTIW